MAEAETEVKAPSVEVLKRWDESMKRMGEGTSKIFTNELSEAEIVLRSGMLLPEGVFTALPNILRCLPSLNHTIPQGASLRVSVISEAHLHCKTHWRLSSRCDLFCIKINSSKLHSAKLQYPYHRLLCRASLLSQTISSMNVEIGSGRQKIWWRRARIPTGSERM